MAAEPRSDVPLSVGVGRRQKRWALTADADDAVVLTQFVEACLTTTVVCRTALLNDSLRREKTLSARERPQTRRGRRGVAEGLGRSQAVKRLWMSGRSARCWG
ncbi:hypothetical protein GCM10010317_102680 [Streptomyces mirabilis]|nr:hypothetical protein GCM10010317_102680 [Streptomyces mirabilis]